MKTYLFWGLYSIENYQIIVNFKYDNYDEFVTYCRKTIFPILDKNGYCIESHDFEGESIFILDMSEWALDIEMFLKGKYSKLSQQAKEKIRDYHTFYDKGEKLLINIAASLDPNYKFPILGGQTAIEYVADGYNLNLSDLQKIGELCSIYNKEKETVGMTVINDKKEIHLDESYYSIEELAKIIEEVRSKPIYDDYKIVIKYGLNEDTIIDGELYLSD